MRILCYFAFSDAPEVRPYAFIKVCLFFCETATRFLQRSKKIPPAFAEGNNGFQKETGGYRSARTGTFRPSSSGRNRGQTFSEEVMTEAAS